MFTRWTYYLIPRFVMGTIIFIFLAYGLLYFYNQTMFPGNGGLPFLLIILAVIISFVISWSFWTGAGRLQIKYLMSGADEAVEKRDFDAAGRYYFKARTILKGSSHFPPDDSGLDAVRFVNRSADFYCAAGWNDSESLIVYADFFRSNPDDDNFARQLIPLITSSDDVRRENLPFLVKLHKLAPDSDEMTDFLASNFLSYEIYSAESQEVLLETVRKYSPLRPLSLKFLLLRMLEQERYDPVAMEIYLEAFNAGLEHRELKPALGRIAEKAKLGSYSGPIAASIRQAFESLPKEEKDSIAGVLRKQRLEKVVVSDKDSDVRKPVEREPAKEIVFTNDAEPVEYEEIFKPGLAATVSRIIEKFFGAIGAVFKYSLSLFSKIFASLFQSLIKRWSLVRWALAGIVIIGLMAGISSIVGNLRQPPAQSSLEVVSDKPFTIQVAAFKDRDRAENAVRQMKTSTVRPYISAGRGETVWYQVRLGFYDSIEEAKRAAEEMKITNYFIANFAPGTYVE